MGCSESDDVTPFQGNIVGFVNLIDNNGYESKDISGVSISIEGTSHSAVTNENGRFTLTDIEAGTYNLIYEKTGYGTSKLLSYQFVGGGEPAFVDVQNIYALPTVEILNLDMAYTDQATLFSEYGVNIEIETTDADNVGLTVFFYQSNEVSKSKYDTSLTFSSSYSMPQISTRANLDNSPYVKGDTVFAKVYFFNYNEYVHYDYDLGDYTYWSYKEASDVIKFIIE